MAVRKTNRVGSFSSISSVKKPSVKNDDNKTLPWHGRIATSFKNLANAIINKITPAFFRKRLKLYEVSTAIETNKLSASTPDPKDKQLDILSLLRKGFPLEESEQLYNEKLAQSASYYDFRDTIHDIPEKEYYDKYSSKKQIKDKSKQASLILSDLGYNEKKISLIISDTLDKATNFDEFLELINTLPTSKESSLGYKNPAEVKKDKQHYVKYMQGRGYGLTYSKEIVEQAYGSAKHKTGIEDELFDIIKKQGYASHKDYSDLFNSYVEKFKPVIGELEVDEFVRKIQTEASNKDKCIEALEDALNEHNIPTDYVQAPITDDSSTENIGQKHLDNLIDTITKIEQLISDSLTVSGNESKGLQITTNLQNIQSTLNNSVNEYLKIKNSLNIESNLTEEENNDIQDREQKLLRSCDRFLVKYARFYKADVNADISDYTTSYQNNVEQLQKYINKIRSI